MGIPFISRLIVYLAIAQSIAFAQMRLDDRNYLSLDLGTTFSWHNQAQGFYFPYVYEFDSRQPSVAQKLKFVDLGTGLGYRGGVSLDLGLLDGAAVRFTARYAYHTTSNREQATYDCNGNLGTSGMTTLESYYHARWHYIGGDVFLRKSFAAQKYYGLVGIGYSH